MLRGWFCDAAIVLLISCFAEIVPSADDAPTDMHLQSLMDRLAGVSADMKGKKTTLQSLDRLRQSVSRGGRIELTPVQREYLERQNPLVSQVTYDTKHRPVSTNRSRHVHRSRTIGNSSEVALHAFMPLKKESGTAKSGPLTFLVTVSADGKLSAHTVLGDLLIDSFDLGHQSGRRIKHLVLSPNRERHFVVTADDLGEIRMHKLTVVAKADSSRTRAASASTARRASKESITKGLSVDSDNTTDVDVEAQIDIESDSCNSSVENLTSADSEEYSQQQLGDGDEKDAKIDDFNLVARIQNKKVTASPHFVCSCKLPSGPEDEALDLEALISVDQGDETFLAVGDSYGGISVFTSNCKLEGRTKVTEDPGGVRGFARGRPHQLLFFSSFSFGFFSAQKLDMGYVPCSGWTVPLVDVALDPNHGYSRAILALQDGDILVFTTKQNQQRVCELVQKFPRVSQLPFKLQMWKGHTVGLQLAPRESDDFRELFFFNTASVDAVHGDVASRIVTAQLNFYPRKLAGFAIHALPGMAPGERSKALLAVRFFGERGVEVSDLRLKQPPQEQSPAEREKQLNWIMIIVVCSILCVVVLCFRKPKVKRSSDKSSDESGEPNNGQDAHSGKQSSPPRREEEREYEDSDAPRIEEVFDD